MDKKKTSESGKAFIKSFEGKRLVAYDDGTGVWTIGCGTIKYPNFLSCLHGSEQGMADCHIFF